MFLPRIDPRRRRPAGAGVPLARPGPFAASAGGGLSGGGVGLGVDRPHARGGAGRNAAGRLGLRFQQRQPGILLGDAPCGGQQRERDGVGPQGIEFARRGGITVAALQGRHQLVERFRTCRRAAHGQDIRACALPAQGVLGRKSEKSCRRVKCCTRSISAVYWLCLLDSDHGRSGRLGPDLVWSVGSPAG